MKNRLLMGAVLMALVAWLAPAVQAGLVDDPSDIPANAEIKGKLQDASSLFRFTPGRRRGRGPEMSRADAVGA